MDAACCSLSTRTSSARNNQRSPSEIRPRHPLGCAQTAPYWQARDDHADDQVAVQAARRAFSWPLPRLSVMRSIEVAGRLPPSARQERVGPCRVLAAADIRTRPDHRRPRRRRPLVRRGPGSVPPRAHAPPASAEPGTDCVGLHQPVNKDHRERARPESVSSPGPVTAFYPPIVSAGPHARSRLRPPIRPAASA